MFSNLVYNEGTVSDFFNSDIYPHSQKNHKSNLGKAKQFKMTLPRYLRYLNDFVGILDISAENFKLKSK